MSIDINLRDPAILAAMDEKLEKRSATHSTERHICQQPWLSKSSNLAWKSTIIDGRQHSSRNGTKGTRKRTLKNRKRTLKNVMMRLKRAVRRVMIPMGRLKIRMGSQKLRNKRGQSTPILRLAVPYTLDGLRRDKRSSRNWWTLIRRPERTKRPRPLRRCA